MRLAINGAELAYDDAGSGDPPFLFVHGFACDRTAWRPQFEDLSRDHRCVAVDLRGRGESPATPPFDVSTAADDLAALIVQLGIERPVVVGHSLGGLVALVLNYRHPELVRGIVTGDSPITGDPAAGLERASARIAADGSMEPMRPMVEGFFVEGTSESVRLAVRETMLGCPPEVAAGMFANATALPPMADLVKAADRKPFMAIWAERPLGDPAALRASTMFVRQEPVAGTGHFFQLEEPAITTALLRAFLDDIARDPRVAAS